MKPFAVTLLIAIVYLSFAPRVSAQCSDWAACAGQRADAQARISQWARETAVAVAEERRAIATERAWDRMIALTATEAARPTRTPVPTVAPQPSATVQATVTPQPTRTVEPTPNLGATVVSVAVGIVKPPQPTPRPASVDEMAQRQTISMILIVAIIVVLAGGIWFVFRVLTAKHVIEI